MPSTNSWATAPERPEAVRDEVHLWWFDAPANGAAYSGLLGDDEVARAERIQVPGKRDSFVFGRATLRRVLGIYLDRSPADIDIVAGEFGKPRLRGEDLSFNVSHSEGILLVAVSSGREVGVDVECYRPGVAMEDVAALFFTADDRMALAEADDAERVAVFLRTWTRIEARAKATGLGLTAAAAAGFADDGRWQMRDVEMGAGRAAAVCAEGDGWGIQLWSGHG